MKTVLFLSFLTLSLLLISASCEDEHPDYPIPEREVKWRVADSTTKMYFEQVFFVDQNFGWAVGMRSGTWWANSIAYTRNGGWYWDYYGYPPEFNHSDMKSVFFINKDVGWVAGTFGVILHTTDGGKTWRQQPTGVNLHIRKIVFKDSQNGRAVGDNGLFLFTNNGGAEWKKINSHITAHYADVKYNYGALYLIGFDGNTKFYYANDAVNLYEYTVPTPSTPPIRLNALFVKGQNTWIAGRSGFISKSTDDGLSWTYQAKFDYQSLNDITFIDNNNGWAVGDNGVILYTTNGGSNWQKYDILVNGNFKSVFFLNNNMGWAITDHYIYKFSENY